MKQLLTITCLFILITVRSQKLDLHLKKQVLPASLVILAGAADGLNQVLQYKYPTFKKAFPSLHGDWWNPKISGANKYKNGKKENGEKYFGSSTIFVAPTDANHTTRWIEHGAMIGAVAFTIGMQKKKWYIYAAEIASYWLLNRAAFTVVYNSF